MGQGQVWGIGPRLGRYSRELTEGLRGLPGVHLKLAEGIRILLGVLRELAEGDRELTRIASRSLSEED
ncbi:hypothetical protein BHM03_00059254 [Ensete ventricosum]|nr:hypothetical protein BHM03_00059254 [Ensete ventricosum]